jgi:hypothetical protein
MLQIDYKYKGCYVENDFNTNIFIAAFTTANVRLRLYKMLDILGESLVYYDTDSFVYTGCPKNGVLTVHYGVEEITVNVRKMLKKSYWTYLLIRRSLKVALNRSIILKYMYEIVMTATSICTYYHKIQDHSLPISSPA